PAFSSNGSATTSAAGADVAATSLPWYFALPASVNVNDPSAALAAGVSVTLTSLAPFGIGFSAAATFGGSAPGASAISSVKPASRTAVTVTVAAAPRNASPASSFAVSANGGFGVTATARPCSRLGGGYGRLASDALM